MVSKTVVNGSSYDSIRIASINSLNNEEDFLDFRLPNLLAELRRVDADVVLLQEAIVNARDEIREGLAELGYKFSYFARYCLDQKNPGRMNSTAIFSRIEGTEFSEIAFEDPYGSGSEEKFMSSAVATFQVRGRAYHVLSNHFTWGGGAERLRLTQAKQVTQYAVDVRAVDPSAVIVLGGDLNTVDDSETFRYLRGWDASPDDHIVGRDLWVDAWTVWGSPENYATSHGSDYWGAKTAYGVGIAIPELIPPRRIDYIMTFGWAYGRPGCPLSFGRFADVATGDRNEVSDHYGIYADLLIDQTSN